jgi:uncharacterized ion transporter superfamily protein YfcC
VRLRAPHPIALLVVCVLLAGAATWVLPAGAYQRQHDDVTGRDVVVAGSYAPVAASPVGPFRALVGIPKGIAAAADVVAFVFLVGGAFAVIERTGALRRALQRLLDAVGGRRWLVVIAVSLAFAAGGALENMQEEIIAFVPLLVLLVRGLGFDTLTACAMSVGAAAVGSAFSPINPFQVIIAQKVAQLPPGSGATPRLVALAIALAIWIAGTLRYARAHATEPEPLQLTETVATHGWRLDLILVLVAGGLAMLPIGLNVFGWGFDELSALFFVIGAVAGLAAGLGVSGTSEAFGEGFRQMAVAALVIGFAKGISVVLDQGHVLDTIVHGLVTPLTGLPPAASAVAMQGVQSLIHVPVPSVSSQAVLTMPILVPVSDLLGISRQVTVMAYQFGAGLCEIVTPTNGALMAIIAAAGVPYEKWMRFALPMYGVLMVMGAIVLIAA